MHWLFAAVLTVTQHWLVLGDLHVNPFDDSPAPATYRADSNWPLVRSTIAAMRRADANPQVIVLAGDHLAHEWNAKARTAGQDPQRAALQTFAQLAGAFGRAFPHAQFLIAMGNNDDPCGDYRTASDTKYLAAVARAWAPLVNRNGAAPDFLRSFAQGGYYRAKLPGGSIAVVLNDVYWSFFFRPCGRSAGTAEFAWFEGTLASLKSGQQAIPILHIPPGVDPVATLMAHRFIIIPYWNGGARDRFQRDLQRYETRIPFAIAAHMHRSDFRSIGGVPMLVVSSVSPIYDNNPSFTRLIFAGDASPADYKIDTLDFDTGEWGHEFDFDQMFGVHGFSAASVARAHERIASDARVREQWEQAMTGGSSASYDIRHSWLAYWCAQAETGQAYITCAGDRRRTTAVYAALIAAVAVVVAAAVWYSRRRLWKRRQNSGG